MSIEDHERTLNLLLGSQSEDNKYFDLVAHHRRIRQKHKEREIDETIIDLTKRLSAIEKALKTK